MRGERDNKRFRVFGKRGIVISSTLFIFILRTLTLLRVRLRRALRGLSAAERCLTQSGVTYGNEVEVIEVIRLAVDYERGEFAKVREQSLRLRESLLKGDSWSGIVFSVGANLYFEHLFFKRAVGRSA